MSRELFAQYGLRVFRLTGRKDVATGDAIVRLVRHWEQVETLLRDRPIGPWIYGIFETRLNEIPLRK